MSIPIDPQTLRKGEFVTILAKLVGYDKIFLGELLSVVSIDLPFVRFHREEYPQATDITVDTRNCVIGTVNAEMVQTIAYKNPPSATNPKSAKEELAEKLYKISTHPKFAEWFVNFIVARFQMGPFSKATGISQFKKLLDLVDFK